MGKGKAALALAAGVIALFWGHAAAQQAAPATPRFDRGDRVEALPVEIFDRIVYLHAKVNGAGPFTFVLDTGAGMFSALDPSVARWLSLGLTPLPRGGGAGEEQVELNRADSVTLAFPGLTFADLSVVTIPLHRMDPHWGKTKDGLMGGDLLSTLVTRIDYENERINFYDASKYEYTGPGERIPITNQDGFLFVDARLLLFGRDEPVDAFMLLDTGVRLSILNTPFSEAHQLGAQSPKTTEGVTGFGIGGVSRGVVGRVREFRLGSYVFAQPVLNFSTDRSGALADPGFAGIIGADFLSRFHVVIDYSRSCIVLEKNRLFDDSFEFDMCGIRFIAEGERFESLKVFSIFDNSPAAEAGIQEGDVVTAIDGREAGTFTWENLREYMQRDGKNVRLTVQRGDETKTFSLRLRRLV